MNEQLIESALDALTCEYKCVHRALVRLISNFNEHLAKEIMATHSRYYEIVGTERDFAKKSHTNLLERHGVIAEHLPPLAVATLPLPSLWAATGTLGDIWIVGIPCGVISFYREFCNIIFWSREEHKLDQELKSSIHKMSRLVGAHLELGTFDFMGIEFLPQRSKPLIEHLIQVAYEFFILHEGYHAMKNHAEPNMYETTWYQEAHLRHQDEFDADAWAFKTLLSSFSNNIDSVTSAIALLFDALDLLDRHSFTPMKRLTHPSPATRKWRLMRFLEAPDALPFLDPERLAKAKEFSLLYERIGAFLTSRAKPASPLNDILNKSAFKEPRWFIELILPIMATGDPTLIVNQLCNMKENLPDWLLHSQNSGDKEFVEKVNQNIESLARFLLDEPSLRRFGETILSIS